MYRSYKISKKYSVSEARIKVANMSTPKKWPYIIAGLFSCPAVVAQWWFDRLENFGLGIGVVLWIMALLMAMVASAGLLKAFVILRYKAYKYFKKN